ncbi:hypothetical protein PHYSODRAFT_525964 [Phytophthora sojae]|uniref:Uncharacterized protein n=1 Tax=Phytophthora sojae (strain P6497) TaxID=1094619 RepID=G5A8K6_PHYSP|nr:hypothetical protein PHYSODRAFT_525964 [Phytophthora sojae]EGZ08232.1 hypothetical protein PHYSODRAFT_525964 [Phytophthora sojae]|eukprot:XP_009536404.1 hypothetical protein PHYSODRAFT_525964 [Phytophthora sojae]
MEFILSIWGPASKLFKDSPPLLMALFSARLGSRGLSLMHFMPLLENDLLAHTSDNSGFTMDFSNKTTPPPTPLECTSYDDILSALYGLKSFGNKLWFDYLNVLISRLIHFVSDNRSQDPSNSSIRVKRTLQLSNAFLGAALDHLAADSPSWWRDYWGEVHKISSESLSWILALQNIQASQVACLRAAATAHTGSATAPSAHASSDGNRRSQANSYNPIPEHIRRQVPRRPDGTEPCLRFFGGSMCHGGTVDRCAYSKRTHVWDSPLPREVQSCINRLYGGNKRSHYGPQRG